MMRKEAQALAETRAKALLRALYAATRMDEISRDYNMVSALTKPSIALVSCLANSGTSRETAYYARGVGFARAYVAEIRAVLTAAHEVGYLAYHYEDLARKASEMDDVLRDIQGVLDARICG